MRSFSEMETSYNQTISTKNNEIENLKIEVEGLSTKNADYETNQTVMQKKIESLNSEVDILKQTVESGGMVFFRRTLIPRKLDDERMR